MCDPCRGTVELDNRQPPLNVACEDRPVGGILINAPAAVAVRKVPRKIGVVISYFYGVGRVADVDH